MHTNSSEHDRYAYHNAQLARRERGVDVTLEVGVENVGGYSVGHGCLNTPIHEHSTQTMVSDQVPSPDTDMAINT